MPRYWVNGAGVWDNSNTFNWSDTSNGTGGFSVPTNTDDVYFDNYSCGLGEAVDVAAGSHPCLNFNTTGFLGTIQGAGVTSQISIFGNAVLGSTGTFAPVQLPIVTFSGNGNSHNITTNGQSWGRVNFSGNAASSFTLLDDFIAYNADTAIITLIAGTLNANGFNFTCRRFLTSGGATKVLNMGSGTWNITGGYIVPNNVNALVWDASNLTTLNKGTANIYLSGASGFSRNFYTGGFAYNKLTNGQITGGGGRLTITGGGSFTELANVKQAPYSIYFDTANTTTVDLFSACGNYDNPSWQGTLTGDIDSFQTTGIVAYVPTPDNYPTSGTIKIDNEVISYTGITITSSVYIEYTGVTRHVNGTSPATHTVGHTVYTPYVLTVNSTDQVTQASIITKAPSGIFYVGANSTNGGNNTGVTFSSGGILDYMNISNLNVTTISTSQGTFFDLFN